MNRVVSFCSGKGGVGKTTMVANLGCMWARNGRRILVVDGDWSLGKMGIMLGVAPKYTVEDVVKGKRSMDDVIEPVHKNLSLLASPSGQIGFEELSEVARNQLYFEFEQLHDKYDFVLFDHSSGVHWNVIQFAAAAHQHVIVTTMEPTSYTDAYAIMKILAMRFGIREFSLLVTMAANIRDTEEAVWRFTEVVRNNLDIRLQVLDIIPWDAKIRDSIISRKSYVEMFPKGELTQKFSRLCQQVEGTKCKPRHGLNYFYRHQQTNGLKTR